MVYGCSRLGGTVSLYGRRRIYSDLSCLVRYEPAALTYALLCRSPCTVILGVSGYRAPGFGFLRLFAPAMCSPLRRLRGGFGALPALCHKSEPSAGKARLPPSGCIRGFTLAAPAINQSGRGSYAVVSALLYSRLTRSESSVSMRAAICGAAAAALLARFYIRALHAQRAAFPCAQRYAARQQRRFSTRGGMRRGRTVPDYAFRIPHSAFSHAAITFSAFYFTPYLSRYASMRARMSSSI